MKTGRLSKPEWKFILDNYLTMTDEEMGAKLQRDPECIREFRQRKVGKTIDDIDDEDETIVQELYEKTFYSELKGQFSKKELASFTGYWVGYIKQFSKDVTFGEEILISSLIKVRLLADRNLTERFKCQKEVEKIEQQIIEFNKVNGDGPYLDGAISYQRQQLEVQLRSAEASYVSRTKEYETFLAKEMAYSRDLKAARAERQDILKNSKKDWLNLLRQLKEDDFRKVESRELGLMNIAKENERKRLGSYNDYDDKTLDRPLLTAETVILDETEE